MLLARAGAGFLVQWYLTGLNSSSCCDSSVLPRVWVGDSFLARPWYRGGPGLVLGRCGNCHSASRGCCCKVGTFACMERSIWVSGQVGGIGAMAQGGATKGVIICEDCVGLDSDHRTDLFRRRK